MPFPVVSDDQIGSFDARVGDAAQRRLEHGERLFLKLILVGDLGQTDDARERFSSAVHLPHDLHRLLHDFAATVVRAIRWRDVSKYGELASVPHQRLYFRFAETDSLAIEDLGAMFQRVVNYV